MFVKFDFLSLCPIFGQVSKRREKLPINIQVSEYLCEMFHLMVRFLIIALLWLKILFVY